MQLATTRHRRFGRALRYIALAVVAVGTLAGHQIKAAPSETAASNTTNEGVTIRSSER